MPGADDPAILADIAKSVVGRHLPLIRTALTEIDKRAGDVVEQGVGRCSTR
jgi:hypothetical protein